MTAPTTARQAEFALGSWVHQQMPSRTLSTKQGEQFQWLLKQALAEAREQGAAAERERVRAALRASYIVHPDDSHGQGYINHGIRVGLAHVLPEGTDLTTPCEPDADRRHTASVWCKSHYAPMQGWCCYFARRAWVWHDARLAEQGGAAEGER